MKDYKKEISLLLKLMRQGQGFEIRSEDKKSFTIIGILIVALVMIPSCAAAGFITYVMTLAFIEAGGQTEGLVFVIQFLSAFALVFGFSVIMNEFYFSSDIDLILPLPVRPLSIISAKFIMTYISESAMEIIVILSAWIGYLAAVGPDLKNILICVLATLTLPIAPLVYCGIMSFFIMLGFSGIRNKKMLNGFMTVLSILLLFAAIISFGGLEGLSIESFVDMLVNHKNRFMNIMNVVFYPGYVLISADSLNSVSDILIYLLSNLALLAIFMVLAVKTYMKSLMAFKSAADKKNVRSRKPSGNIKRRPVFLSLFMKEIKLLLRTPGFVTNCLLINIFWPVIVIVILLMQRGNDTIDRFIFTYHFGYVLAHISMIAIFLALAALTTAANSIASSAVTREGKHAAYMKYIPVSYEMLLLIKALVSIIISILSYLADVLIIKKVLLLSLRDTFYYILLGLCMIIFITALGIILDTKNPKLVWEDEANALRANINVFINMAAALLSGMVIIGIGFILYFIKSTTIFFISFFYLFGMILLAVAMSFIAIQKGSDNMSKMEL